VFKRKSKQQTEQLGCENEIDLSKVPTHIAIIPDGNRRWAKLHNMPKELGHKEGAYAFKKIVKEAYRYGIKYITFYAFSTENWSREDKEVKALMSLMLNFLKNAEREIAGDDVVIKVIGDKSVLSEELQREIDRVEKLTSVNGGIILYLAINYGGRKEIIEAVKKTAECVLNKNIDIDDINEEFLASKMYSNCPDPDLLIRTSKEARISNFLLYQMAYTEFYFTDVLWPDFNESELKKALFSYQERQRRFGGV